jgi:hypothetical protein
MSDPKCDYVSPELHEYGDVQTMTRTNQEADRTDVPLGTPVDGPILGT